MSTLASLLIIAVVAGVTLLTRALPFGVFKNKNVPDIVKYLGEALPVAVITILVVYCLKDTPLAAYPHGLPELISVAVVILLKIFVRSTLISIFSGTALYMLLIQFVFTA
jgi:branched-subunit amino acid transport protein AzlD